MANSNRFDNLRLGQQQVCLKNPFDRYPKGRILATQNTIPFTREAAIAEFDRP